MILASNVCDAKWFINELKSRGCEIQKIHDIANICEKEQEIQREENRQLKEKNNELLIESNTLQKENSKTNKRYLIAYVILTIMVLARRFWTSGWRKIFGPSSIRKL